MIEKIPCRLITKYKFHFYDMVNIHSIMINNVYIFTIYESLLQNVIKILPKIYRHKTNVPGKIVRKGKWYQLSTSYLTCSLTGQVKVLQ